MMPITALNVFYNRRSVTLRKAASVTYDMTFIEGIALPALEVDVKQVK